MRSFFVVPEETTLPLFDDGAYWVKVKKTLNAGESRQLAQSAFSRVSPTGTPDNPSVAFDINIEAGAFGKIMIYLLDWNLPDAAGKTVAIDTPKAKRDALRALAPDVFVEIERVIDAHAAAKDPAVKDPNVLSSTPGSSTT
jgi:hypothetical protein